MKKLFSLLAACLFFSLVALSQPKYEFRAVWVATVVNIDWPSKPGLSTYAQQREIIDILNLHESLGMNAIILQVRPAADAFYQSDLEPWSRYLTGVQGQAPLPFYDPLEFWIEECHKRGMELHAWLNPYRVAQKLDDPLAINHIAFQHPDWILKYGNRLYFDPGLPQAREFVTSVVQDIVKRYDVDAIHFDDYFYPYPLKEEFPDSTSFKYYSRGFANKNKADWRRENVDITIKMLNDSIKATKPWVKFGISPFGVWRNKTDDPLGSDTKAGATNYDHLYANIIKWQKEGWIDYTLPQLYWQIGHPAVDFQLLANWWKDHSYGRAMYIGQAPYKVSRTSQTKEWTEPDQLTKQIQILRSIPEIQGSSFYSSKWFNGDLLGLQDSLKLGYYKSPAIVPPMPWLDNQAPQPLVKIKKWGRKIKWTPAEAQSEMDKAWSYVLYLNEVGEKFDQNNAKYVYTITKDPQFKFNRINRKKKKYELRISVLDRLSNESRLSVPIKIRL
ncbi:glycoside hydrolase family 10 protein [Draconibacterium halophilum]|uniref:Family 10 glycosylhydrolase n=1 Tax=Draconibacterium halophilum TaxID=2706887 RepID=A0A6C0R8L6_9BACT|nr:family 10 glycosylhydrolase [Draconibacterium halophilum]QIA06764.1 family 10 glycosylhydrolase [Draconibacterium halophilum]